MKKQLILGAAAAVIFALLSGCAGNAQTGGSFNAGAASEGDASSAMAQASYTAQDGTPAARPAEPVPPDAPLVGTDKYEYKTDYIEVSIKTPVLNGPSGGGAYKDINAVFADYKKAAKTEIPSLEEDSRSLIEDGITVGPYVMDISFRVPYNQPGLISIVLDDYRYTGGAHGGDIRTAYTFDLETGRQLGLGDLMKEGSDYRSFINQRIRQEIDKMVQESGFSELATFEDIGDSPNFYLTDDAIVFFFQQYEYFPYAAGIPEFAIPYSDLDGMLNGDFLPPPGA